MSTTRSCFTVCKQHPAEGSTSCARNNTEVTTIPVHHEQVNFWQVEASVSWTKINSARENYWGMGSMFRVAFVGEGTVPSPLGDTWLRSEAVGMTFSCSSPSDKDVRASHQEDPVPGTWNGGYWAGIQSFLTATLTHKKYFMQHSAEEMIWQTDEIHKEKSEFVRVSESINSQTWVWMESWK